VAQFTTGAFPGAGGGCFRRMGGANHAAFRDRRWVAAESNAVEIQKTDTSARLADAALRQRYSAEKRYTCAANSRHCRTFGGPRRNQRDTGHVQSPVAAPPSIGQRPVPKIGRLVFPHCAFASMRISPRQCVPGRASRAPARRRSAFVSAREAGRLGDKPQGNLQQARRSKELVGRQRAWSRARAISRHSGEFGEVNDGARAAGRDSQVRPRVKT